MHRILFALRHRSGLHGDGNSVILEYMERNDDDGL